MTIQKFERKKEQSLGKRTNHLIQLVKRQPVNPARDYEGGQTVKILFRKEQHCKIAFTGGAQLNEISKDECIKQCEAEDACQSITYKSSKTATDTGQCNLNIKTKYDVWSYFTCNDDVSKPWDYYEKIRDCFRIFNKGSGLVVKAKHENTVESAKINEDKSYWFWADTNIRSKRYPQTDLVPGQINQRTKKGKVTLSSLNSSILQKWSYDGNAIEAISDDHNFKGQIDVANANKVIISSSEHVSTRYCILSLPRNYFIITNRGNGNVLDADTCNNGRVILWQCYGQDNKLWGWDDDSIRSKEFPNKVLQVERARSYIGYANAILRKLLFGNYGQKWTAPRDQDIIEGVRNPLSQDYNPTLCAENFSTANDTKVATCPLQGKCNNKWTFIASRAYFFIFDKRAVKVISANTTSSVQMEHYEMSNKQLWFWDADTIQSKRYANKVMTMSSNNRISLEPFSGSPQQNWIYKNNFITSSYKNMKIKESGSSALRKSRSYQKWSITMSHDFLSLWSKFYGIVLDVAAMQNVIAWPYHGHDYQRFFWNDRSIRSKRYPNQVLDIKPGSGNRLSVFFDEYSSSPIQNWRHVKYEAISDKESRKLSLRNYVNEEYHERVIACSGCESTDYLKWRYSPQITYLGNVESKFKGVLVFCLFKGNLKIRMKRQQNGDSKYWFWECSRIRSKKDIRFVRTLWKRAGWRYSSLIAERFKSPQDVNFVQLFAYDEDQYIFPQLKGYSIIHCYSRVFAMPKTELRRRIRRLIMYARQEVKKVKEENAKSCINKTEAKIYSVFEWIPLISTLWDLFSSIGYAIAGCHTMAQERAINLALCVATDVATAFTFAFASAPLAVLKTGLKVGLKFGMKAGLKAIANVARTSVKRSIAKLVKQRFKISLKKAAANAGKLIVRETIIDPALFLKNVWKFSKKVLVKPKKTFFNAVKTGRAGITKLLN